MATARERKELGLKIGQPGGPLGQPDLAGLALLALSRIIEQAY
jgi:hypothetical protein